MSTAEAPVTTRLLEAIARRDQDGIRACFAPDATFTMLTPQRVREHTGPDEAADRYAFWLMPLEEFEVLDAEAVPVADRVRIRYRFRGRNPEKGWQENEHTGYATVDGDRIASLRLTCAGFRPVEAPR